MVVTVEISPTNASIPAGQLRLFTATVLNDGIPLPLGLVPVTWAIAPTSGQVIASSPYTALVRTEGLIGLRSNAITATVITSPSVVGFASFTITPGAVATITVSPSVDTLTVGGQRQFTASATDAFGNAVPNLNVTWAVSPTAGTVGTTTPNTMIFLAGTTPGFYNNAIEARIGSVAGRASVLLQAGPPASVVVTPSVATVAINATQGFQAAVYDQFGNPLNLGVTWLVQGGTLDSSQPNAAVYRAGTVAGVYPTGLIAANGKVQRAVPITIPTGPVAGVRLEAKPDTITTNGQDSSTILATVTDAFGNATGAGTQVVFSVDQCAGSCDLSPLSGVADANGTVAATLRSTNTSATQTLVSTIKVSAELRPNPSSTAGSVNVTGRFVPYKNFASVLPNAPINNHTSCTAQTLTPPQSAAQPSDQSFNIYRFTAQAAAHTVAIQNYASTGQILFYRILSDRCATNNTLTLAFVGSYAITSATQYQKVLNGLAVGSQYLLAVNTTSRLSGQLYTITLQ